MISEKSKLQKGIEIHKNLRSQNESKYMMWITYLGNHKTEDRFPQLLFWSKSVRYKEVYLSELGSMLTEWIRIPFMVILSIYLILDIVFSFFKQRTDKISFLSGCASLIIYPLFHISYGVGSLMGIVHYIFGSRSRENKSENKR